MPQSPPSHQMWDAGVLCFSSQRGQQLDYWAPNHKEAGSLLADRGLQVKDKKADLKSHITSNNGKTLWNLNIKGAEKALYSSQRSGRVRKRVNFSCLLCIKRQQSWVFIHTHTQHWPHFIFTLTPRPPPTDTWGNWVSETSSHLSRVTQLVNGRAALCTQTQRFLLSSCYTTQWRFGASRQGGREKGRKSSWEESPFLLTYCNPFVFLLGLWVHCAECFLYKTLLWDNLNSL